MRDQLECWFSHLEEGEECVESLWVRIKGWVGMADIILGVYYRSSNQEDEVDEAISKEPHNPVHWFSWGNLIIQISVG